MLKCTGMIPARQAAVNVENTPSQTENLWTTTDVAAYLRVSPRFVQRQVSAGKLPRPSMVGRLPRWAPSVIRDHVARGGCA